MTLDIVFSEFLFFFSSRRRHTRWNYDWSSDVCSSDLDACWKSPDPDEALNQFERFLAAAGPRAGYVELLAARPELLAGLVRLCAGGDLLAQLLVAQPELLSSLADRSVLEGRRTRAAF